jgi:4-amino-4-deoxy-L-arabinose transferase-like glycosyltransferase
LADRKKTNNSRNFLLIVFILAFFLRFFFILTVDNSVNIWGDWWSDAAVNLLQGKSLAVSDPVTGSENLFYSWRTPIFPLFIAGVYTLFGIENYLAVKIFMALLGALSCILIYFTAKRIFNESTGKLTAVISAIFPSFIFFNAYMAPVILTLFILSLAFFFVTRDIEKPSVLNFIMGGIALGMAILTRELLAVFFVAVLLWMPFYYLQKKKMLLKTLLLFIFTLLTLSPWIIRNYKIYNRFVIDSSNGIWTLYAANNEKTVEDPRGYNYNYSKEELKGYTELELKSIFKKWTLDFISSHPSVYLQLVKERFLDFWRLFPHTISGPGKPYNRLHIVLGLIYTVPLFLFAAIGFLYSIYDDKWKKSLIIYLFIFFYSTIHVLFRSAIRFRIPIEPYLIIMGSFGLYTIWNRLLLQKRLAAGDGDCRQKRKNQEELNGK